MFHYVYVFERIVSCWVLLCESEIIRDLKLDARVQRTWVELQYLKTDLSVVVCMLELF